MSAAKVERIHRDNTTFTSVNQLVNEALKRWGVVVGLDKKMEDRTISIGGREEAFSSYDLQRHVEELNVSRKRDPSGLTTLMMLRGLTDHHLKTHAFTVYEVLTGLDKVNAELQPLRDLYALVEDPFYAKVMDDFAELLRKAADHYGVPGGRKNKALTELLADKYDLAMLRRDALKSIDKLEAHQFCRGEPDPKSLMYNEKVFEFWNINSLLKTLQGQAVPGISMCLIRDPEAALSSFFVFAVKNGETLTVLTDRTEEAHPEGKFMHRRPSRDFEARAEQHWFPYQLLELEQDGRGDYYAKQRTSIVPYKVEAVPLKKIGELPAYQFVWAVLMFDLIRDKYWLNNLQLPDLSYTGEMVVKPDALLDVGSALVRSGQYVPLQAAPLVLKDVSLDATKEQWAHKSTEHNRWLEERYGDKVDVKYLNPVGEKAVKQLHADYKKDKSLAREERYISHASFDKEIVPVGGKLASFSPVAFGTKEQLEKDRTWVGRVNKMRIIQGAAEKEYEKEKEKAKEWYRQALEKNAKQLLEWSARQEWKAKSWRGGFGDTGFKVGYQRFKNEDRFCQLVAPHAYTFGGRGIYINGGDVMKVEYETDWGGKRGIFGQYPKKAVRKKKNHGWMGCFFHRDVHAQVHSCFDPNCPEAIALLLGLEVKDLHWALQHWLPDEPYAGNHILDRVEPSDWVLHNPWKEFRVSVVFATCKTCIHDERKRLGLAPVKLERNIEKEREKNRW